MHEAIKVYKNVLLDRLYKLNYFYFCRNRDINTQRVAFSQSKAILLITLNIDLTKKSSIQGVPYKVSHF